MRPSTQMHEHPALWEVGHGTNLETHEPSPSAVHGISLSLLVLLLPLPLPPTPGPSSQAVALLSGEIGAKFLASLKPRTWLSLGQ